ncbi:MAG: prepilin-type N-terminal cleavage/methylation domain-containing protein, partial [Planctomycetota bacterium]
MRKSGFTLVEVLVASVMGAFIVFVAVGTLKTISASAKVVDSSAYTAAMVRFASGMVARDLANLYRDEDIKSMKLVGAVEGSGDRMASYLTLYTVGRVKARIDQPEGDVYEVEYYISREGEKSALMRRLWPNPDKEAEPGGMLTEIAENIDVFQVMFFDGK